MIYLTNTIGLNSGIVGTFIKFVHPSKACSLILVTPFGIFVELDNTVEGLVKFEDIPGDYFMYDDNVSSNILDFPLVIKPCSCGSSVGVSIVNNENDWEKHSSCCSGVIDLSQPKKDNKACKDCLCCAQ